MTEAWQPARTKRVAAPENRPASLRCPARNDPPVVSILPQWATVKKLGFETFICTLPGQSHFHSAHHL
jgi:hypothetical protein